MDNRKLMYGGIIIFLFVGTYLVFNMNDKAKTDEYLYQIDAVEQVGQDKVIFEEDNMFYIDISGAIMDPGVYQLHPGSILNDVIKEAGGYSEGYDRKYVEQNINLAQRITDGQKVYIPFEGESVVNVVQNSTGDSVKNELININSATLSELETLTGIGPATAKLIIDGRPYSSIEDIMKVKGIGEATFIKIKDHICV